MVFAPHVAMTKPERKSNSLMKRRSIIQSAVLACLAVLPGLAQTIGGGVCNSSALSGTYEILLTGRQVTAAGTTSKLFQAVGTAAFNGLNTVTWTLTANTAGASLSTGTPLSYTGSYSLQSNCMGQVSITGGTTATFTLEAYAFNSTTQKAGSFAVIGSDANYAYNGTGSIQPATCPTTIAGAHEFNATGSTLSGGAVTGALDVAGVLQFDGQGNLTASWTQVANLTSTAIAATGTYSVNSTCLASATLTDAASNKYTVSMSLNSASPAFALTVASPSEMFDGSGAAVQVATPAGCSLSSLSGPYELNLTGRATPGGVTTKTLMSNGVATFDGAGKVAFALTGNAVNGSQSFGTPLSYSGTYSLPSSCQGSISLTSGDTATFSMVAYSLNATSAFASSFQLVGADANYNFNGGGTVQPAACAASTLSGAWSFNATGFTLSGSTNSGILDVAGLIQFDGQGNATATWTQLSNTATTNVSANGTYSVTGACLGSISLTDTAANKYSGTLSVSGLTAGSVLLAVSNPQLVFTGSGRPGFGNPGLAAVNAASFVASETPAGSIFSIFGSNLATKEGQATALPLPTTLVTTSVTVNGEPAPLFYAGPTQINAQMPEDINPGVATVVVKVGSAANNTTSNAVAVTVPAVGTPGVLVYGNNRAVVINADGSVNSPTSPAKVGEIVVAYFTGGGPVNASGTLTTGAGSPGGLSPVSGPNSATVGGVDATVKYMGLTPGSVGLYQANLVIPAVSTADHPLVLTISGQASNNPLIAVTK
jgi:uncharacterized protein (TIGR03437 family)